MADRSVTVKMTFNDIERRTRQVKPFRWIYLITLMPFDLERPNSAG